eukprot:GHVN01079958.1.p1 GENE.GHVN01079958.1~~GHVN01079958.1.p1  ORF type:complete len:493 (+),score=38.66 GHVN01079958.1:229-1707(+)
MLRLSSMYRVCQRGCHLGNASKRFGRFGPSLNPNQIRFNASLLLKAQRPQLKPVNLLSRTGSSTNSQWVHSGIQFRDHFLNQRQNFSANSTKRSRDHQDYRGGSAAFGHAAEKQDPTHSQRAHHSHESHEFRENHYAIGGLSWGPPLTLLYFLFASKWKHLPGYFPTITASSLIVFGAWWAATLKWGSKGAASGGFTISEKNMRQTFVARHFLASAENLKAWRFHTLLTSGISHISPFHLFCNLFVWEQLGWSLGDKITSSELLTVLGSSVVASSVAHIAASNMPALGLSGGIFGLFAVQAAIDPDKRFQLIFPPCGMKLNALQIYQLLMGSNVVLFAWGLMKKGAQRVSWVGHLAGGLAGLFFVEVSRRQQERDVRERVNLTVAVLRERNGGHLTYTGDPSLEKQAEIDVYHHVSDNTLRRWANLWRDSRERGTRDWRRSFGDVKDGFQLFNLRRKIARLEPDSREWVELNHKLEELKFRRHHRWDDGEPF